MPVTPSPVELRGLGVSINARPILRDIDLSIRPGEVLAILGGNGSGKSTLVKAALGLVPASTGLVELFGHPPAGFRQWSRIGYVPQHSALSHGVVSSVREVVSSGRLSRRRPFHPVSRQDRDAVSAALDVVGLADRASQPMTTLSGGQQQRALIARALAGQPELLFMDEPNAGVDLQNQQLIADSLHELVDAGTTLVVVLHELGPFEPWIQRCVVLTDGRITHQGSAQSLPDSARTPHVHHNYSTPAHPSAYEGLIRGES